MLRAAIAIAVALAGPALGCAAEPGVSEVSQQEVLAWIESDQGPVLVDTRSREEYESGHVPGAIHIPHDEVAQRLDELEPYRERGVVLYCERGGRAGQAAEVLLREDFPDVRHLEGDMSAWRSKNRPVER